MTITHRIQSKWSSPGSTSSVTGTGSATGDSEIIADLALDADAGDWEFDLSWDKDFSRSVFILSDQDGIFKTNDSGSPADQFNLHAGVSVQYQNATDQVNPFTADVTKIFLTNSNADAAATVKIRILLSAFND